MIIKTVSCETFAQILTTAAEFGGNATSALKTAGIVIIDGSTGEERHPTGGENEGRPRRPLIGEYPEPRLEIVGSPEDLEAERLRELDEQAAILGW